jgi:hypothetical protein
MKRIIITALAAVAMLVPVAPAQAASWDEPLDCPGASYYDPAFGECIPPPEADYPDCPAGSDFDPVLNECERTPTLPRWHRCRSDYFNVTRLRVTRATCVEANEAVVRLVKRYAGGKRPRHAHIQDYNCTTSKRIIDGRRTYKGETFEWYHWNVKCSGRRWQHPVVKFRYEEDSA